MGVTSFFTDMGTEMIIPILPIFLYSVLGVNRAFIGLIEGIAEATASLLKIVSGWISDKIGSRKEIVILGYSLSTVAKPLLSLATTGWHVLFVRFADRLGKGLRTSPRDALIADSCDGCDLGKSFGFHRAMDTAGAMVGPLLLFVLLPLFHNNFRIIFLLSAIPAAVAVLVLVIFVKESRKPSSSIHNDEIISEKTSFNLRSLLNRDFIAFTLIFTLFTLGNSSDAFLILRAQDMKVSLALIPLLWLLFNFVYTFTSTPAGKLSDFIGRKRVLALGLLIYSIVYFGFSRATSSWQIWLLFAVYGTFYGLTEGVSRALIADSVPSNIRATAYGIYNTSIGISVFFASVIMGLLWQFLGTSIAFSFGAVLSLVSAVLLMLFLE